MLEEITNCVHKVMSIILIYIEMEINCLTKVKNYLPSIYKLTKRFLIFL